MAQFVDNTAIPSSSGGREIKRLNSELLWTEAERDISTFSESDQKAFEELKAIVADEKLTCNEIEQGLFKLDDTALKRFLVARDFNVKKARKMLERHLAWRDEMMPCMIVPKDIPNIYNSQVYTVLGKSKDGANVVLSLTKNFEPSQYSVEEFTKYVAFTCERSVRMMEADKSSQHIFVFDLSGWSVMKHGGMKPTQMTKNLIDIAQSHYPERLLLSLVINSPWVFQGFWRVISPFIDPKVKKKVIFGQPSTLLDYMHESDVPTEYGGTKEFADIPMHPPGEVLPGEMSRE